MSAGTDVLATMAWGDWPPPMELPGYRLPAAPDRERIREFALDYDADRVLERYWKPALGQIQERIG